MRVPRIYLNEALSTGSSVILPAEAHRHVVNVLRLREQDNLVLFNGQGSEFPAIITDIEKKQTTVHVENEIRPVTTSPLEIELAISLIKNDKLDFAVQKAVELGVHKIAPLNTDRTTIKLDKKRELKRHTHWQGIIQSACEQCGQNTLPQLGEVQTIAEWLSSSDNPGIIFEPAARLSLKELDIHNKLRIIIGPEGGFTEAELEQVKQHNFKCVRLGPRVLRAETAAITAISSLQLLWGDLN